MVTIPRELSDELHRSVKLALDTGEAPTAAAAYALFREYRLGVVCGPQIAQSPTLQAALLTAVNAGRRCFLGGVAVAGDLDAALRLHWGRCRTVREAVVDLGGTPVESMEPDVPAIVIGGFDSAGRSTSSRRDFAVRATFEGWTAGVSPAGSGCRLAERQEFTPAGVLAGALAASEAFQHVRGNVAAGRRDVGLSLWRPEPEVSWHSEEAIGPHLSLLPTKLWLLGLGHLGQSVLWTLGFLPYPDPAELELVLHDFDTLVVANDSTSPLTTRGIVGRKKTRAMAEWCDTRGFRSTIVERRFAANFHVAADEPEILLCGVDNAEARAALEEVGFARVIEAGLGSGPTEYLAFQVHTFPGPQRARDRWGGARGGSAVSAERLARLPAYEALAADGLDGCGLATLAGRAVGAPFVGLVASTLVVAEAMRVVAGGPQYGIVDGNLRDVSRRAAVRSSSPAPRGWNPGFCRAVDA